ncbi:BTB/POZ domain-containing protein [Hibiscus syriacus]|uniref:BTB/POZ domain-containing protein n=1 Tax=Hibiscus syriacus TaxID=106335 RepID=A0A6A3C107_HIBSY|nr:BTB/POZ domain-containing protein At1g63850-like [Hibiscus syriacus]KAE8722504.1 BTB/POZ domain-containing protein [Hibiscus syriacus]
MSLYPNFSPDWPAPVLVPTANAVTSVKDNKIQAKKQSDIELMATTTAQLKVQVQYIKQKRRKCKETTISSSATGNNCSHSTPVSPAPSPPPPSPPPLPPQAAGVPGLGSNDSLSGFKIRYCPGRVSPVMDFTGRTTLSNGHSPWSFIEFNSALTAGLLNPMSPPPPADKTRSTPTLFEMMGNEPDIHSSNQTQNQAKIQVPTSAPRQNQPPFIVDMQALTMQRISDLLSTRSPGNQFNDPISRDIKLTLSSKDGISVSMNVHRHILVAHSRFFAVKLSDRSPETNGSGEPYSLEIADCEDVEVYIETLRLMYGKDLRKMLMREEVSSVLGILKVSVAIGFDAGVLSCLEYLEAAPWTVDEEEKVASLLAELHLENVGAGEVLKRVSVEVTNGIDGGDNERVLLKLLHLVLQGNDEKARCEMKELVLKMLRENPSRNDLRKASLYSACDGCLELLQYHFLQAASSDLQDVNQIARQADNLHWILDILVDRQIAEDFLKSWASQSELSETHSKVPAIHRFEISRVTARLFIGIGKGQLLASEEVRSLLLQTWLVPFYDDFRWMMMRASKGLDRHLIEDGLSNMILTLALPLQQDIFLAWLDRFLNSGEDCPNIQRGFEVWWRRAFWR